MGDCEYELCGSETPICAKTYMTSPEQSKPLGLAPPHTYGTPRYRIAIPTTPPWIEGGATVDASGAVALTPTGLLIRWRAAPGCAAAPLRAARRRAPARSAPVATPRGAAGLRASRS